MRHHRAFDGRANVEEYDLHVPGRPYQALAIRAYDDVSRQWSIWWLDSRHPSHGPGIPVRGGFDGDVGLFYADEETPQGEPCVLRFRWDRNGPGAARWEQAVSTDGGASWEPNWIMEFTSEAPRLPPGRGRR
jgi:hypothetical protein